MDYKKLWMKLMIYLSDTEERVTKIKMLADMKDMELAEMRSNNE